MRTAVTADDGAFRAEGLAPGRNAVEFSDGPCARIVALQEEGGADPPDPHGAAVQWSRQPEWRAAHARILVERRGANLAWVQATGPDGTARLELSPGTWFVGHDRPGPWSGFAGAPHELRIEAGRAYVVDVAVGR